MKEFLWQVTCRLARDNSSTEQLYGALVGVVINPEEIVEQMKSGRLEVVIFSTSAKRATTLLKIIRSLKFRGLKVTLKVLKKTDWQDRWKKGIKPFALTKKFDIVPRWTKVKYLKKNKFPIYIDTNLAFGTGLHETTRFMAQLIESCQGDFSSFLDVGTGSGILAIIARYSGAKRIAAFDIDQQSIRVAKTNFAANEVKDVKLFCADLQKWKSKSKFDFVAANLVTDDLISFGKKLVALVGESRYLAISGISLKNLPRLQRAFKILPLKKLKVIRGKEWAAILFKKISL